MSLVLIFGLVGATLLLILVLALTVVGRREPLATLDLKLLLVEIARPEAETEAKDPLPAINLSEQIISSLAALKAPFVLEAAVHNTAGEIYFYLAVPAAAADFAKQQIQGLFPDAQVSPAPDYNVFHPAGGHAGAYLTLAQDHALPLRTYQEVKIDTFAPIVSTLANLKEVGDGAAIQLVIKPAPATVAKRLQNLVQALAKGKKLSELIQSGAPALFRELKAVAGAAPASKEKNARPAVIEEENFKAVQAKLSKPLFLVNLRLVASAETQSRADDLLLSVSGAFSQLAAPQRNRLTAFKPRRLNRLFYQFSFREFDARHYSVLNTEEIASLWHLPVATTAVPRIKWLKTREAPPPANLPATGIALGENNFRGERRPVNFLPEDRRRHLYLVGQTGTGKSYLMLNLAVQDIAAGQGVAVIDPHGDLIDKILERIPPHRLADVIVFDPGDLARPLGLNMFEYDLANPQEKTFIVNELIAIFDRLYDLKVTGGPMFEQFMRNAVLLLMEDAQTEPATFMEVPRIFTDPEWRKRKLARIKNPTVVDFWEKEAAKTTGEQGLANMTPYVTSKFGSFLANDYLRPIVGQTKSAFNFRQLMDEGKILLVNLAKGKIGDLNAALLGMIITGRLLFAALARSDVEEVKRRDFYLYIDEFQNFTTESIAVILSEARKYRLNLTLAHQFIAQLTDPIREAVFGNVGSLVSFRVGVKDAEFLVKHFSPEFSERDLIAVENQQAFVKLLINGEPSRAFNLKTRPAAIGSPEVRDKLKELSRLTYGRDLAEIEQEIINRLRQ